MFIRVKYIKNQPYAYKVENRWTRKGTRQRTAGYLGRIFYLTPQNPLSFEDHIKPRVLEEYLKNLSSREIILDLVRFELIRHGFKPKGKNKNILFLEQFEGDNSKGNNSPVLKAMLKAELAPSILTITDTKKPVVLAINNDFLCDYTLRKLARFKSLSDEEECGRELAKAFIHAGMPPPHLLFVDVFQKVYSSLGSYVKGPLESPTVSATNPADQVKVNI
jgi:hypothetical protein